MNFHAALISICVTPNPGDTTLEPHDTTASLASPTSPEGNDKKNEHKVTSQKGDYMHTYVSTCYCSTYVAAIPMYGYYKLFQYCVFIYCTV